MESPYPFGGAQSRGVRPHTNTPWVAANPPPSSFGDYPAQPLGRVLFFTKPVCRVNSLRVFFNPNATGCVLQLE